MSGEEWYKITKQGDLIDVKRDSAWRVAKVVAITETQFRCEFVKQINGRVTREFIRKTSERLSPLGTYTAEDDRPSAAPAGAAPVAGQVVAGNFQRAELVEGFGMTLSVGDKCDCRDQNKWRTAQVIGRQGDSWRIHFEGWGSRWDEWVPERSIKLQPLNSQTGGAFTGDPKMQHQDVPAQMFTPVDNTPKQWKRIMSHGLSDPQVKKMDTIFEMACKFQDTQRQIVLGKAVDVEKLEGELAEFKQKIQSTSEGLPRVQAGCLQICSNIVSDIKSTLSETKRQKRQQDLLSKEDEYFKRLHKDFYFVNIPSDGNCLFGATGRGMKFGKILSGCQHDGEVKALVDQARKVTVNESSDIATDFRLRAVMNLQEEKYTARVVAELKHAIETASGGGGNPTSKTIVAQLRAAFKDKDLMKAAETKQAIGIYCQVMMSPRVFGTELEAQALSEVIKCPLHIYYRVTGDFEKEGKLEATKIIGSEYEKDNPAVHLAFYMGKSHYDLLVQKHEKSDPEEIKRKEARMLERKERGFSKYRFQFTKCRGAETDRLSLNQVRFFSGGKWTPAPEPKNPGGHSPANHTPFCLIDGDDNTKMMDMNFKKNGMTTLVYEFEKPTVINDYEIVYAKDDSKSDPVSWILYGDTNQDGPVKLSERSKIDTDGSVRTTLEFFPPPKEEKSSVDVKQQAESKNEAEKKEPVKGEEKKEEISNTEVEKKNGMDISSGPSPAGNPAGAPAGNPAGEPAVSVGDAAVSPAAPAAPAVQQPVPGVVEPSAPRESDETQDKRATKEEDFENPS